MTNNLFTQIFDWLRTCPKLSELWSIIGEEKGQYQNNSNIIAPSGSTELYIKDISRDSLGNISYRLKPYPVITMDLPILAYAEAVLDPAPPTENYNNARLNDVQECIDWIINQNNTGNLPVVDGYKILGVIPAPPIAQLYGEAGESGVVDTIKYGFTLQVDYVNKAAEVCYEC